MELVKKDSNTITSLKYPVKKIDENIREKLRASFPSEATDNHTIGTIKEIYIIERLNSVFGIGRWTFNHEIIKETDTEVLVKGKLKLLDYDAEIPSLYGSGSTTINSRLADSYKASLVDSLNKCANYIEIGIDVSKCKTKSIDETAQSSVNLNNQDTVNTSSEQKILSPEVRKKHFIEDCQNCDTSGDLLEIRKAYQDLIQTDKDLEEKYRKFEITFLIKDSFKTCSTLKEWSGLHEIYQKYHEAEFYKSIAFEKYQQLVKSSKPLS